WRFKRPGALRPLPLAHSGALCAADSKGGFPVLSYAVGFVSLILFYPYNPYTTYF
ncbi:hypothetical protein A2U01_0101285, partial [Trifolium medium]|nr:hypothetical protein [Trifolium medium]